VRLDRYFGNRVQFRLDLWSQYDIAMIEREQEARSRGASSSRTTTGEGPAKAL
jgi:plasmid maintenance system antidote protein VapI